MVAEGNFYISEVTVRLPLRSKVAEAMKKCRAESEMYAKCVDAGQVNRTLLRDCCLEERIALRKCTDVNWHELRDGLRKSH
mmetsp:Transcript_71504/g.83180  ORF Transcript_71504/g.83180 Transcript_71504/m.83180 type:complete len:81 (-) Transcript_71504:101-343(-)